VRSKEGGLAVLQKHITTDRQLAEVGYKLLLEDLMPYSFVTVKGVKTVQEIVALRDPKIGKYNVEDLSISAFWKSSQKRLR
jgi:hypothetical protein